MRDDFTTKERTGAGTGEVLARLGYALVGALVAVLVSAMMSLVPWPADDTLFPVYVNASVMGATLMLWASFKPSRGSAGAVAAEALTVFVTVLVVQMVGSCLQSPSLFGLYPNPLSWVWDHAIFMLYSGLALVLADILGARQQRAVGAALVQTGPRRACVRPGGMGARCKRRP